MNQSEIISILQNVVGDPSVMQYAFQTIFQYDTAIGIAFDGDYNIQPKNIYPIGQNDSGIMGLITYDTTRNGLSLKYTLIATVSESGVQLQVLYPGNSNVDLQLYGDFIGALIGLTGDESSIIAETELLTEISPTGWEERWTLLTSSGEKIQKEMVFISDGIGGTTWTIR